MQDYSVSFITAAIALVAMVIFLSVDIASNVKKTIWMRLFNKASYIPGMLLILAVAILEKEKLLNFVSNPLSWMKFAGYAALVVLALDGVLVLFRGLAVRNRSEDEESQGC